MVFQVDLVIRRQVFLSFPSHLQEGLMDRIRLFHVIAGLLGRNGGVLEARKHSAFAVDEHFLAVFVVFLFQIGLRADAA